MKVLAAWDWLKGVISIVYAGAMTYLHPVSGDISSLILLFGFNFATGLVADILVNNSSFSFQKAFKCIKEATVFVLLVAGIFAIGRFKNIEEGSLTAVSLVTYAVIYFYALNILRNLKSLFKEGSSPYKVLDFLYYILSAECIKSIPYLTNYLNKKSNADQ